jgi:hypothetical protein
MVVQLREKFRTLKHGDFISQYAEKGNQKVTHLAKAIKASLLGFELKTSRHAV